MTAHEERKQLIVLLDESMITGARQAQEDGLAVSHLGFRTILLAPGP